MEKSAPSDPELLAEWLGQHRETAFHTLVARYAGLVHATAKRACGGDDSMAGEVSQLTFIALAQKARSLTTCASLGGWLHLTTMMQAKNLIRKSQRENRKLQHLQAAMESEPPRPSTDVWQEMQPLLNDALASLSEKDRETLLLRFYRCLSVRETAETLGIATYAAQKRIDRATARLRGKLARRGCAAGGSLAAVLLAGFATDSQAASLPLSTLASKAIATHTAGSVSLSSLLTITMKASTFASPVIALILSGAWIVSQRQTIQALDRRSDFLENALATRTSSLTADALPVKTARSNSHKNGNGRLSVDWNEVAGQFAGVNPHGQLNQVDAFMLDKRMGEMTQEQLLAGIDEISALDTTDEIKMRMEETLVHSLGNRFPEFTVVNLIHRYQGSTGTAPYYLADAFRKWAQDDFTRASAWMDARIAAGTFDHKSLSGENWLQNQLQQIVVKSLLSQPGDAAALRVMQVPEELRENLLLGVSFESLKPDETAQFGKLVRDSLTLEGQQKVLSRAACKFADDLPSLAPFLENIGATPEERALCVGNVAVSNIGKICLARKVASDDISAIRSWIGEQMPAEVDRFTARALDSAVMMQARTTFTEAAALAVEFSQSSGDDELLAEFLKGSSARSNKDQARAVAEKISDEARRAEILKNLN
jgi:RNA polymerase sigma factor (sigma-70 family)